jgi:hypothetical protein
MGVRFAGALALALAATWLVAGPAAALEPGVFVDPGSPAGKEYGVPLSQLRGAGSGHTPVGNQPPPLFGIGVSPASGPALPSARRRGGPRQSRPGHPAGGRRGAAGATPAGAAGSLGVPRTVLAGLTHQGSAVPEVALIGVVVMLGGLALGCLLVTARHRLD